MFTCLWQSFQIVQVNSLTFVAAARKEKVNIFGNKNDLIYSDILGTPYANLQLNSGDLHGKWLGCTSHIPEAVGSKGGHHF
jgi:hypothetical protein